MNLNEKIDTNNTQIGKHFVILIALERFYGDGGGKNVACGTVLKSRTTNVKAYCFPTPGYSRETHSPLYFSPQSHDIDSLTQYF